MKQPNFEKLGSEQEIADAKEVYHTLAGHTLVNYTIKPQWDFAKGRWNWNSDLDTLRQCIIDMRLAHDECINGNFTDGNIYQPLNPPSLHLRDYNDPIFTHRMVRKVISYWHYDIWSRSKLEYVLDIGNPIERFLFYSINIITDTSLKTFPSPLLIT